MSRTSRTTSLAVVLTVLLGFLTGCTGGDDQAPQMSDSIYVCNTKTLESDVVETKKEIVPPLSTDMTKCRQRDKAEQKAFDKQVARQEAQDARTVRRASERVTHDVNATPGRTEKLMAIINLACRRHYALDENDIAFLNHEEGVIGATGGLDMDLLKMYNNRYQKIWRPGYGPAQLKLRLTDEMKWSCPGSISPNRLPHTDFNSGG